MGSIIKRGINSWLLKYDVPKLSADAKREQRYKTVRGTREDAKRELAKIVTELNQGTYVKPQKTTLAEWLNFWLKNHAEPNVTPKTHERYSQLIRVHIIPELGAIQLQKITIPMLQSFYAKLFREGLSASKRSRVKNNQNNEVEIVSEEVEGLSPRTIRHVHRVLSMALSEGIRANEIFKNPAKEMRTPKFAQKSEEDGIEQIKALNSEQLTKLLNAFRDKPIFPLLSVAAGTGARQGELLGLRWSDVDLNQGSIWVRRSVEDTCKGQRFKSPKSRKAREIKIDAGLIRLLRAHWKTQAETALKLGIGMQSEALVFPRSPVEPTLPMRRHGLSRAVSKCAEELGFAGFSFHSLRHTHASLLLAAGVPLSTISHRLGHASVAVTAGIYAHFIKDGQDKAATEAGKFLEAVLAE